MVLVSHNYRFIFIKTKKTASTSVEAFFERYCLDPNIPHKCVEHLDSIKTEFGTIGTRGKPKKDADIWHSHKPAFEIQKDLGKKLFKKYFKFCVVRNPWDYVVSWYCYCTKIEQFTISFPEFVAQMKELKNQLSQEGKAFSDFSFANRIDCRDLMGNVTKMPLYVNNWELYTINNFPVCDFYIRYENLENDIIEVCKRLKISDYDLSELPQFKVGFRDPNKSYRDYYDRNSADIVAEINKNEIEYFGYLW